MAKNEKKVLLFIVEGLSDKVSLEGQFVNFFSSYNVQVAVMRCDVTSEVSAPEIKAHLNDKIEEFCGIEKVRKTDIKRIVHLIDTDGAFVPDESVKQGSSGETEYTETEILAKDKNALVERNKRKSSVLSKLSSMRSLADIDYEVYFMSRNLEHVLHNKIENLSNLDKTQLSEDFDDVYADNLEGFLNYIATDSFAVKGDYKQTWDFIKTDTNSLKRYSNLHLLFTKSE